MFFLLNKQENDISNLHAKCGTYIVYDIYKMVDLNLLEFHQPLGPNLENYL